MDLQKVINNHSKVFGEMLKGVPPTWDHGNAIKSVQPNIRNYRYPCAQKSDIEHMVQEMLEASTIQPSESIDYKKLNIMKIKDMFPILYYSNHMEEFCILI